MTSYLYELPTTGAISFADVCLDATATYITDIADATEVAIRVQGFVVDCDLRVLGDWNRCV